MTFPTWFGVSEGLFCYIKMSALTAKVNVQFCSGPVINKCYIVAIYCVGVGLSLCSLVGYKEMLRIYLFVGVVIKKSLKSF